MCASKHCPATVMASLQGQDEDRAARSLDQNGVSTSAQMEVRVRSEIGDIKLGRPLGRLQAQCLVDAGSNQAVLQQVSCSVGAYIHIST